MARSGRVVGIPHRGTGIGCSLGGFLRVGRHPFVEIVKVFEMVGHSSINQTYDATGRH